MKTLYLLTTKGLGDHYVLANNPDIAEKELITKLTDADYGFYGDRQVTDIKILAKELTDFVEKPNFSGKETKIIIT